MVWSTRKTGILDTIGVERDWGTIEEPQKLAQLTQHVEHGLTECALRKHGVGHLVEPGLEFHHERRSLRSAGTKRSSTEAELISGSMRYSRLTPIVP